MKLSLGSILLAAPGVVFLTSGEATVATAVTALDGCHLHGLVQYCNAQPAGTEMAVTTAASAAEASALPQEYTNCHNHDGETFCEDSAGSDVFMAALSGLTESDTHAGHTEEDHAEEDHAGHAEEDHAAHAEDEDPATGAASATENCHFHAGVEHCTGGASAAAATCAKVDRSYNVPLRIGSIFIVLTTSSVAVFLPLVLRRFARLATDSIVFTIIKQFGTGVIIATAFIHLLTHAQMMFANECVGELGYESVTTAICMAGIFVAFMVEYSGHRYIQRREDAKRGALLARSREEEEAVDASTVASADKPAGTAATGTEDASFHDTTNSDDRLSVFVMEMGIIFHSILIGITLVVAGDSGFATLLVVIIFHQMFEGLALGTRISMLSSETELDRTKVMLAGLFSLITPIGMAIGIGVRDQFNGSDKNTLIAMGTLDAFSAGILVWVGVVEMLAHDWLHGDLKRSGLARTLVAGTSLVVGMVFMGLLGKWA